MRIFLLMAVCFGVLTLSSSVLAYNFSYIHPTKGIPIGWDNTKTIQYWVDPGPLGGFTNAQALTLVQEAMKVWENASSNAKVPKFEFMGFLPEDVDGTNYQKYVSAGYCYTDDLTQCENQTQKDLKTVIVFDQDEQILQNGLCKIGDCIAYATASVLGGSVANPSFIQAAVVTIGARLTGGSNESVKALMVHELGHLLGLAHTSVNQEAYFKNEQESKIYIPVMFFVDSAFSASLRPDDVAGISTLYPVDPYSPNLAIIKGTIKMSDGTPMQYMNVIARNVNDPLCDAYSMRSGRFCPPPLNYQNGGCYDGNGDVFVGDYVISGIPPGTYTVEVEDIDSSMQSSISPGAIQSLFGDAEFWNENDVANESNTASSTITLAAGETRSGIDIILNRSTVTPDRIQSIPLNTFTPGPGTNCPKNSTNTNPTVTGSTDTSSAGGCSLVR